MAFQQPLVQKPGAPLAVAPPSYGAAGSQPAQARQYTATEKAQMPPAQRKQVEKQEKEQGDRERRDRVRSQQVKQKIEDGKNFVIRMTFSQIFLSVLLGVLMGGNSWCYKQFTGPGIGMLEVRTSMFTMSVDVNCAKSLSLEVRICKQKFANLEGTHSLHSVQGVACAISASSCNVFTRVYHTSLFFGTAILCNLLAVFFLYSYSFTSSHPKLRQWSTFLTFSGPLFATLGLVLWALTVPDLAEIPEAQGDISESSMHLVDLLPFAGKFFTYQALNEIQYGWCFFGGIIVCFLLVVQGFFWQSFFQKDKDGEDELIWEEIRQQAYIDSLDYAA